MGLGLVFLVGNGVGFGVLLAVGIVRMVFLFFSSWYLLSELCDAILFWFYRRRSLVPDVVGVFGPR